MSFENGIVPKIKYKKPETFRFVLVRIFHRLTNGLHKEFKRYFDTEILFDFSVLPQDQLLLLNAEINKVAEVYEDRLSNADLYLLKKEAAKELLAGHNICAVSLRWRAVMIYARKHMCM